jgi:hypothetical protein
LNDPILVEAAAAEVVALATPLDVVPVDPDALGAEIVGAV